MTILNENNYLERQIKKGFKENIWLIKEDRYGHGMITMKQISLPSKYIGKRCRLKLILEEVK